MKTYKTIKSVFKDSKKISKLIKGFRYIYLMIVIIESSVSAIANTLIGFILKYAIDAAVNKELKYLYYSIVLLIFGTTFLAILSYFIDIKSGDLKNRIEFTIKQKVFRHLLNIKVSYFDNNHSGDIISRLNNDLNMLTDIFKKNIPNLISSILGGIIPSIFMIILNPLLGLIVLLVGLATVLVNSLFTPYFKKQGVEIQKTTSTIMKNINDIQNGFTTIKLYNMQKLFLNRLDKSIVELKQQNYNITALSAWKNVINIFINFINFIGIYFIGAIMVMKGYTTFGSITAIIQMRNSTDFMFNSLGSFIVEFNTAMAGVDRVYEFLSVCEEPERYDIEGDQSNAIVSLKNIYFCYDDKKKLINDLSLTINKKGIIAFVGETGCGKSTIFKILLGFYKVNSGSITIEGKGLKDYTLQQLRSKIAYIPQDNYLFNGTIKENIKYGNIYATDEEILQAAKLANAHDFITKIPEQYNFNVGDGGILLSAGQRQRLAIARAFLSKASIILLDEPTSNLDLQTETIINDSVKALVQNKTMIIIAHRLSTIKNANIIYFFKNGTIIGKGTHDELINKCNEYATFYTTGHNDLQCQNLFLKF